MNPDIALVDEILSGRLQLPAAFDSSPIARALGMRIVRIDKEAGDTVVQFTPSETFLQGAGVLQGGAITAMLDFAMIVPVMAFAPAGSSPASANLDTVYFRPAHPGTYRATARVRRRTRVAIFAEATLHAANGAEIAAASSTVLIKPPLTSEDSSNNGE